MKCLVVIFVLVAVWAGRGEAVRCEDVIDCAPDTSRMGSSSPADIAAVCTSIQTAIRCFRAAMQDCRETKSIPEETIQNLEGQIDTYDNMLNQHCHSGESGNNGDDQASAGSQGSYNGAVGDVRPYVIVVFVIAFLAAFL